MAADAALNNGLSVARLRALLNLLNLLYLLKRGAATPPRALPCRFRHVADVPGVQGQLEVWRLGSLAFLHPTPPVARLSRVPFSVAVEGLALRACTLCSPFSGAATPPLGPSCTFVSAPQGEPSTHSHRFARLPPANQQGGGATPCVFVDTVTAQVRRRCRGVGGSWGRRPVRCGGWSGRRRDRAGRSGDCGFARGPPRPCRRP